MKKVFLGINVSHGASAALMIDGEIILTYQEERFNKIKNFVGYPKKSIDHCIKFAKEKDLIIDEASFSTVRNHIFAFKYPLDHYFSTDDWLNFYLNNFFSKKIKIQNVIERFKKNKKNKKNIDLYLKFNKINKKDYFGNFKLFENLQREFLIKQSKGIIKKISFIDHHTCHAYYAAFAPNIKEKQTAILTIDSD